MSEPILSGPDVVAWFDEVAPKYGEGSPYRSCLKGVLWIDEPAEDGEPIGGNDPSRIINGVNEGIWPVLDNHDPGKLLGRVVAAKLFRSPEGVGFVAGYIGLYDQKAVLHLSDLDIAVTKPAPPPTAVPEPHPSWRIQLLHDPRELESAWIEELAQGAPLPVVVDHLSHNAADTIIELLRVGLPYALLLHPLVTEISKEAGRDIYKIFRSWLASLLERMKERRQPVMSLQSYVGRCEVTFLFRGTDIARLRAAHQALAQAAADAASMIRAIVDRQLSPVSAVYEYDPESGWFPSFVTLADGRIISERNTLFALESSRKGLSLGIVSNPGDDRK